MTGRFARRLAAAMAVALLTACGASPAALDRLYGQSQAHLRRGEIDEALAAAADGIARAQAANDEVRAWRFRLLAVDAQLSGLDLAKAMSTLEQPIPDRPGFESIRGRQLQLLARARVSQGQLQVAEPLIDAAMPLAAGDSALLADLELLRSQVLYRSGRAAEADGLLASTRRRVASESDPYRLAQVAVAAGMGLVTRGRYDEALPYFESVVADRSVEGTTVQGQAFNNAGLCRARLGQFDRAVALQEQAIRVQQRGRRQSLAQAMGELGNTYLLKEDYERSTQYLQQAFAIAAEAGLASDAALFARNLAAAFVALGRWDEAARFNQEAARLTRGSGATSPYALVTDAKIAAGRGRTDEAARLFTAALSAPATTPGVRWMSYEGLARLATAANRPADAARHFEAALRTVEQTRSSLLRADDRISFTSRLLAFYRGYIDLLLSQGHVERALEVADSSRARVLAERQGVATPAPRAAAAGLKQLARTARTTLMFYWLGPQRSWVWTLTGDRITVTELPPGPRIEALVTEHQAAIQNALADPLTSSGSVGARLYAAVVAPIRPAITGQVAIVPDGALHGVNFETLIVPDGQAGNPGQPNAPTGRHYWIEDVAIQIAPSLAMLQRASARPAASLLLVGNAEPRPPEFPALSYAPAEMSGVAKHFAAGGVSVVEGEDASPEGFRRAQPARFSVIHFTSHAVANVENPLDSAVILSGPEQAYKLYAREVASLPLTAELVTVSACRSAGERAYAGEGLVGFAWAFLRAGSRRVVAGLWDVDDRSTAALMDDLYARMSDGATPAVALREAKRALIRAGYPKPYYWAPFQIFTVVL